MHQVNSLGNRFTIGRRTSVCCMRGEWEWVAKGRPGRHWAMRSFSRSRARIRGFSLIELVIVVVIIAIIGAIAIQRLSGVSAGAADSALVGNLRVLRSATDLYATEHGGTYPAITALPTALTQYSNDQGTFSATKSTSYPYGP